MSRATDRLQKLQAKIGNRSGVRAAVSADTAAAGDGETSHAELWLYGIVGGYWFGFNAKDVGDQLRGLDVTSLTVRIHSPGGSLLDGIAIANLLRNHKARVTVVVDGLAASSASLIAIAGDEVVMSPGSQMMLHDASTFLCGNEKELRQEADFIGKQSVNMAEQYAAKAGGTAESWRAKMTADPDGTWYLDKEAVAAKLADRVGTVVAGSPPPEEPAVDPLEEDDDEDIEASAAYVLDTLQLHPAALAAWRPRTAAPKPPTASAGGSIETEGGSAVAFSDEQMTNLRATLGLAETADEAAIVDAINAVVQESLEERPTTPTAQAPHVPEGMALVDAEVLKQIQADAAAGRTAQTTLASQERDRVINKALADGKIAATSRGMFVEAWDKNADSTKAILDALTPGLIATAEAGHEDEPQSLGDGIEINDAELDAFAASLGLTKEALRG